MLTVGSKAAFSITVDSNNTAETVGSGSLPVFATPSLAALVEKTACLCIVEGLEEGCTTVGTLLNIKHLAPSTVGVAVKCECVLKEIDGRRLVFEASVSDNAGVVGEAYHERFIIKSASFMDKARGRAEV